MFALTPRLSPVAQRDIATCASMQPGPIVQFWTSLRRDPKGLARRLGVLVAIGAISVLLLVSAVLIIAVLWLLFLIVSAFSFATAEENRTDWQQFVVDFSDELDGDDWGDWDFD